ncbi:MAG: GvpL/GvpF family gas vesicle protein [Planctomycetes bacterium]|nr:GvpL/GvpF family gas vesicle protein [Planctomycetota bacterium]
MNNTPSDTFLGIYTYCLARTPVTFPHAMMGIDDVHEVCSVEHDGIFAVLSHVSLKEYNEEALEKNMTDVAWLAPRAKRHEEVIEFVMAHAMSNQNAASSPTLFFSHSPILEERGGEGEQGREVIEKYYTPVIPLRFCTIYKNQKGLFKAIMPHREKIRNFLDYTADKIEWSVKVFCDKTVFLNNNDKNKEQFQTANQTSLLPGEAYLLAKKMRKIKEGNFRQDLQMYLKDIDFTLSQFADRYRFLRCADKSIHGRPLDMVMNTAFLVEQQTFNMFKDTLNMLAEKYKDEGLMFELSGPWPPYNFCPEL